MSVWINGGIEQLNFIVFRSYTNDTKLDNEITNLEFKSSITYRIKMYVSVFMILKSLSILQMIYSSSGKIREVLIFANFARRTNSRIQESRESYYYNSASKKKLKHAQISRSTLLQF